MKCKRCGTCCRKGGPAIHIEDIELFKRGVITPENLFTIRKGEPVYDNIKNEYIPLKEELVKIKSRDGKRTCIFFDENSNKCGIYKNRPLECRILECWNPGPIMDLYETDRAERRHFLTEDDEILSIIKKQEECASQVGIKELCEKILKGSDPAPLLELISWDTGMRKFMIEKEYARPEHMDLLFGRPLVRTVESFGLKIKKQENEFVLIKKPLFDRKDVPENGDLDFI